jgi:acetyl esterase/lipase
VAFDRNLVYAAPKGVELHLDLARPGHGQGPFPLVVCYHGGGWQIGHRAMHEDTIRLLARHGFAAATVSYRFAPAHRYPAQLEDATSALGFLCRHAQDYRLDPKRVALLGDSAGAHLALLAGLKPRESPVRAIVNYFGPTDFRAWALSPLGELLVRISFQKDSAGLVRDLLGTADRMAPILAEASPVTHVSAGDPPVLTFHGTLDALVPVSQARLLHDALKKAGVPERLELIEGAPHGWNGRTKEKTDRITLEFLEKHLKGSR